MKNLMRRARVVEIQYPGGCRIVDAHRPMLLSRAWSEARRLSQKAGKCAVFLSFIGGGAKVVRYFDGARA